MDNALVNDLHHRLAGLSFREPLPLDAAAASIAPRTAGVYVVAVGGPLFVTPVTYVGHSKDLRQRLGYWRCGDLLAHSALRGLARYFVARGIIGDTRSSGRTRALLALYAKRHSLWWLRPYNGTEEERLTLERTLYRVVSPTLRDRMDNGRMDEEARRWARGMMDLMDAGGIPPPSPEPRTTDTA